MEIMAITHENKTIEKLLIEKDTYQNQESMYRQQAQELSNEIDDLQGQINKLLQTRITIVNNADYLEDNIEKLAMIIEKLEEIYEG